jgi:hypothetical protein
MSGATNRVGAFGQSGPSFERRRRTPQMSVSVAVVQRRQWSDSTKSELILAVSMLPIVLLAVLLMFVMHIQ